VGGAHPTLKDFYNDRINRDIGISIERLAVGLGIPLSEAVGKNRVKYK
jgi:hypothetical protein